MVKQLPQWLQSTPEKLKGAIDCPLCLRGKKILNFRRLATAIQPPRFFRGRGFFAVTPAHALICPFLRRQESPSATAINPVVKYSRRTWSTRRLETQLRFNLRLWTLEKYVLRKECLLAQFLNSPSATTRNRWVENNKGKHNDFKNLLHRWIAVLLGGLLFWASGCDESNRSTPAPAIWIEQRGAGRCRHRMANGQQFENTAAVRRSGRRLRRRIITDEAGMISSTAEMRRETRPSPAFINSRAAIQRLAKTTADSLIWFGRMGRRSPALPVAAADFYDAQTGIGRIEVIYRFPARFAIAIRFQRGIRAST